MTRTAVLRRIEIERERQIQKFGDQDRPSVDWLAILAEEFGEAAKIVTEDFVPPYNSYPHPVELKNELIQVAAVCVAWLENLP